jgi:hypothetical protein
MLKAGRCVPGVRLLRARRIEEEERASFAVRRHERELVVVIDEELKADLRKETSVVRARGAKFRHVDAEVSEHSLTLARGRGAGVPEGAAQGTSDCWILMAIRTG